MKAKPFFLFPVIAFALNSCTHYYYMPNQQNIPLFQEKKEARLAGGIGFGDAATGIEVQGAYAVTNNVGLLANVSFFNPGKDQDGRGGLYELGAGYYKPFKTNFANTHLVFETYGVAGIGHSRGVYHNDSFPSEIANAQFLKIYAQPSFGISHDIVDFIVSSKIGVLDFYKMKAAKASFINSALAEDINIVRNNRTSFLFEPAVTLRVGFRWVKWNAQFSWCLLSSKVRDRSGRWNLNTGIIVSLAPRFKKKFPNRTR